MFVDRLSAMRAEAERDREAGLVLTVGRRLDASQRRRAETQVGALGSVDAIDLLADLVQRRRLAEIAALGVGQRVERVGPRELRRTLRGDTLRAGNEVGRDSTNVPSTTRVSPISPSVTSAA